MVVLPFSFFVHVLFLLRWCPWTTYVLSVEDRRGLKPEFIGKP